MGGWRNREGFALWAAGERVGSCGSDKGGGAVVDRRRGVCSTDVGAMADVVVVIEERHADDP